MCLRCAEEIDACTSIEQEAHHFCLASDGSNVEWRELHFGRGVYLCAGFKKQLRHRETASL